MSNPFCYLSATELPLRYGSHPSHEEVRSYADDAYDPEDSPVIDTAVPGYEEEDDAAEIASRTG